MAFLRQRQFKFDLVVEDFWCDAGSRFAAQAHEAVVGHGFERASGLRAQRRSVLLLLNPCLTLFLLPI